MMRLHPTWLVIVAVCLGSMHASAETRVRSGEHGEFTRLVLYFPDRVEGWSSTRSDDGYDIDITPAPTSLDTSEVFDFIPRTRIRDVALREGRVRLDSTCDCHLVVFQPRADVIALDVRDGPDPSGTDRATAAPSSTPPAVPALPWVRPRIEQVQAQVASLVPFTPDRQVRDTIDATDLATAVARAASGGLLNARDPSIRLDGPGIETRSALDRANTDRAQAAHRALCEDLDRLNAIIDIAPEEAWRRIDPQTDVARPALDRAMGFLALGFGAEAAATFADSALSPGSALLYARMAHFVDAPDRGMARDLRTASACGGVAGLLAVIATPDTMDISAENARDAVTTLSRLPRPLRAHLSTHLEDRLARAGLDELARSARFTRTRAEPADPDEDQTGASANPADAAAPARAAGMALPDTAFFDPDISGEIFDTIATGRFALEDRVLIEAWIQEAPSPQEADAATAFYVAALNRAGRPLDALAHLDARLGRRGALRPALAQAVRATLAVAPDHLGPGELLLLGARLPERPWYDRLSRQTRENFQARVDALRADLLGPRATAAADTSGAAAQETGTVTAPPRDPGAPPPGSAAAMDMATARQRAIAAVMAAATESLARSSELREAAAERTAAWDDPTTR